MNKWVPEKPVTLEQRPDVEVDKGMPEEGTQQHSLVDHDLCQDFETAFEEKYFEGSSLSLGRTSYDVTIVTSLRTKILSSCRARVNLSV